MSHFADPSIRPTTSAETLAGTFTTHSLTHSDAFNRYPKSVKEGAFRRKEDDTSPSTSCNEFAPCPLHLPPDSLEDVIVEKWVDQPNNTLEDDVGSKGVFRNERSKGARFSPLGSRSKENRKTRSSTSNTVVLPYKREVPRNALVHLRYRHYYPRSIHSGDLRYQNRKSFTCPLPKEHSAVPHDRFFPRALDERAARFECNLAFDDDCSPLEQHLCHVGFSSDCGERRAFMYPTGGSILEELDLEWTRERFAHASIRDDYDSDMTDQ